MAIVVPYQQTENRQVNQFQQALTKALTPLTSNPISNATILPNILLVSGKVTQVPTKINRNIQGWILIRQRGNSVVWDTQDTNQNASQTLALNTTANTIVDLMVF